MLAISFEGMENVQQAFQELLKRSGTLQPLLMEIGEDVTESTKQRFETATDPDGNPWAKNSDVTLAHKKGTLPLTNEGSLAMYIHPNVVSDTSVEIGTNADQGAMMQFGGTTSEFPHLWGNIPARPYLGLSEADKQNILALSLSYFS